MATGIIYDGYPSMDEIKEANGWPDEERFAKGPVAVVECVQQIPCNPCESACPLHAIHIGEPITNTPQVDRRMDAASQRGYGDERAGNLRCRRYGGSGRGQHSDG